MTMRSPRLSTANRRATAAIADTGNTSTDSPVMRRWRPIFPTPLARPALPPSTAHNGTLRVSVMGAAASSPLDVSVNGTSVGTLTTDASGNGTAKLRNVTVSAGDTIQVGDLTGTLAKTRLGATLSGSTDATGRASVDVIKNHLRLRIRGAEANTTYDVSIDGTTVGQIITNGRGSGRLFVSPTAAIIAGSTISILDSTAGTTLVSGSFA